MDPDNVAVVACELKKNILSELLPNLQQEQPERQVQWEGLNLMPRRERTKSVENHHRLNKFQSRGRGRGSKTGRGTGTGKAFNQPDPSTLGEPPKPKSKVVEEKQKGKEVEPLEEKLEKAKISAKKVYNEVDSKVELMPYNLRNGASSNNCDNVVAEPKKAISSADDDKDEFVFKKPDLANITIAQLMPQIVSAKTIASPVACGNLKAKAKNIDDTMPLQNTPPNSSSTMSSVDMSAKLRELAEMSKDGDFTKSILKSSGASVEKLERYEDLTDNKPTKPFCRQVDEFKSGDPQFMPISLAMGHEYLFVSGTSTNQVQVFRDGEQQGVLKIHESKYFNSVRNVHTIPSGKMTSSQVIVLDNQGFHFFVENGLWIHTILGNEGYKYRGLGHTNYNGKLCLVSLEVDDPALGVTVVIIDIEPKSLDRNTIIKRLKISGTNEMPDAATKCRFLAVSPDKRKVFITSLKMNTVFSVDLQTEEIKTFNHGIKEPSGIAIDPKNGTIFVSSRGSKIVETFNGQLGHLGPFMIKNNMAPIGLCFHNDNLYVATNEHKIILKMAIEYASK